MPSQIGRWVTFDCYGTLVDWNSGFEAIIHPLAGDRTRAVVSAYHPLERELERQSPHRLYKDVLTTALAAAAEQAGVPLSAAAARRLSDSWGTLPVFDDVEPMLAALRQAGWRLAVLTNCDEDLFERTHQRFRERFDLVVTAERVRRYKPELAHFRHFSRETGAQPSNWVHVANSWYHDIAPAAQLGIARVWLDRDRTGDDPSTVSAHVHSAEEVLDAVLACSGGM